MTRATAPEKPAVPPSTPTPDAFFDHVRYSNPFDLNRVVPTSMVREDAAQVHRAQFDQLTALAGQALANRCALGAVLWGEAGIGKSHLLARLQRWAAGDGKPDGGRAIFIYLSNLQSRPEMLPRTLLKYVVSILTGGRGRAFMGTRLYRMMIDAVRHALGDAVSGSFTFQQCEAAYRRLLGELIAAAPTQAALVDPAVHGALLLFFRSAYRASKHPEDTTAGLVVRWLAGDPLDPDEARALGIALAGGREEAVALADDEQVKRVLAALAQVAAYGQKPFILCLDQVDNLEPEQFAALSRFLHALLDSAANLLVITSGVRETIFRWEEQGVFTRSAWERLGQEEVELQRISVAEARQIVEARLEPLQERFMELESVKAAVQTDGLFPLGEAWAKGAFADKLEVRPRDVINWARDGWRRQQGVLKQKGGTDWLAGWRGQRSDPDKRTVTEAELRDLIDAKIDLKLQEHLRQRQLHPEALPPDGDNLAGLLHALLRRCAATPAFPALLGVERLPRPKHGPPPTYDLTLRQCSGGAERPAGLLCLAVENRTSMTGYLRRLVQDKAPPSRLFVVTDERRPLDPAEKGREYLDELRRRLGGEFRQVSLTFDEYAELDALQAVVGLARSGDLEIELPGGQAHRVTEPQVAESLLRRRRYLDHPLLRQLLTDEPAPPAKSEKAEPPAPATADFVPDELDLRQFLMGRLGITMGASSMELAVKYREYLQLKQATLGPAECKARLEKVALDLHQEGKLNATPQDDYLYLLLK